MDTTTKTPKYSVNFYLDTTKEQVFMFFSYDGRRVKIYTKENLSSNLWNKKLQKAKVTIENPNCNRTNSNLSEMKNKIGEFFNKFIQDYKRKPEPAELRNIFKKEYFDKLPQFQTERQKLSLLETFDEYIENKKIENAQSTAKQYENARDNLIEFGNKYKQQIQYENINPKFRNDFIKYLKNDKGYADSTIYRRLKFIKTVLFYGLDCRYIESLNINLNKFLTKDRPSVKIALSNFELAELEDLDLSNNLKLDRVRDRFLLGCYTGMRFSDFIRLNKNHIQDNEYIIIKQKKVGETVTIPFFEKIKKIFEKYDYNLPKPISEPNFNSYLKEVTRKCKSLNHLQEITKNIGGKEIRTTIPRSELISSHTARRTFVTLNHAKEVDLEYLIIATGHTTVKALKTYVKLNDKQKADLLDRKFKEIDEKQELKTSGKIIKMIS